MTLNELYRLYLHDLKDIYPENEAADITKLVFESVAGISRADVIRNPEKLLNEPLRSTLKKHLADLKTHQPVQYVIGEAWFYQMKYKVNPAVLIPRPETEELVTGVIEVLKDNPNAAVLDIGTGSGCIPIALKKNMPGAAITAIDVSKEALEVAKENAAIHHTPILLKQLDFLDEQAWNELGSYDIIVSNPPYIPLGEKALLDKNVTAFEPHTALFVPDNTPLIFYEKIAAFGKSHLKENGQVMMETHEDFAMQVLQLFSASGYDAAIIKDMSGKERMVVATRCR